MKKYAPYILILIIVIVGLFSPIRKVNAESPYDACIRINGVGNATSLCSGQSKVDTPAPATCTAPNTPAGCTPAEKSEFEKWATEESCGIIGTSSVAGCTKALFYYIVYTPSAVILAIAATFFNALISISLSSALFSASSSFISTAWGVVRDLSNIFFILILLYIAIKVILGLGGSEVKKMIAKVIIIALLINFSMFFTQVIIDTSNILALIFYNKLEVTYKDPKTGQPIARPYSGATGSTEKDLSGSMYSGFDVTSKLNQDFWNSTKTTTDSTGNSVGTPAEHVPVGTMIGVIIVASAIMLFAAYCFFVSGLAFVARLIELFVLIIFSPFAFMSSTIPLFSRIETLGWDAWFKRLLTASFMAPIFMFFMYLIVLLLSKNLFGSLITNTKSWTQTMLGFLIPGLLILVMLLEATKFAKKGSGVIGEMVMKGAKMAGGLALGAATGGAALLGAGAFGSLASRAASSKGLNEKAKEKGFGGMAARMALKTADYGSKATFDVRKIPGVGGLAKMGGINLEAAKGIGLGSKEGGYQQRRKEQVEKRQKRAKELEVREDEPMKQELNKTEMQLQGVLGQEAREIELLDKTLEKFRQEVSDANNKLNAAKNKYESSKGTPGEAAARLALDGAQTGADKANDDLDKAKTNKTNFRKGAAFTDSTGTTRTASGNIEALEKQQKTQAQAIKTENVERKQAYAERIVKWGGNGIRTDREAAHKIVMEVKLDSGTKT